jgi:CxxC-x17-CxxC domain-containing protein
MAEIICDQCGARDEVPFEPKGGKLYCTDCYRARQKKKRKNAPPRKKHGTRVSFPIECSRCGTEETLDYVPKGVKMSEILCTSCMADEEGPESEWTKVRREKALEEQNEWEIECPECGRTDYLGFEPKPDRIYKCERCFLAERVSDGEEVPARRDRDEMRETESAGPTVRIRRRKKS